MSRNVQSRLNAVLIGTNVTTILGIALWICPPVRDAWRSLKRRALMLIGQLNLPKQGDKTLKVSEERRTPDSPTAKALEKLLGKDYVPPLPAPVAHVLNRSCLCFLATSNEMSPHLSLMRFTYCKSLTDPESEVLILSTRRDTLKYKTLLKNKNVALLVHDFSSENDKDDRNYSEVAMTGGARYSITLNGHVHEETGEIGERYRQVHLERNATYAQFIDGDDIAVVTVTLTSARVCDIHDSVRHYVRTDTGPFSWMETLR